MGLPLFVAPVEPQVAAKATEKPTAAPRSVIRRHRTLRGPHARPHAAETRRRRILSMVATDNSTTPEEYEVWEMQRTSPPNDGDLNSVAYIQDRAHRMFEAGQTRLRDTLSFERQHPRPTNSELDGPLMPPVPESRDYSALEDRPQRVRHITRRLAARNHAPTPPYTESNLASPSRRSSDSSRPSMPNMTPALSISRSSASYGLPSPGRRLLEDAETALSSRRSYRTDPAEGSSLSERVQAINRASMNPRRMMRPSVSARLDGLGDRDRSLSPEGPAAWDTLLTSITPDPQPPSSGSSFASAPSAIAAASSAGSAPVSANTSMTSIGPADETPVLHDCDISDSGSTSDEEDMYELHEFGRNRAGRSWRSYADVVTARADRARAADAEHGDLEDMHMIISRLAEVDEIPDEWWSSAGLSRNLRREPTI
ncbi:hypothetical protein LSUE1_G005715 [Lachnellula suecica]|uniref:Uncharacterized protein n=1 Tax=Lachnellula suecica TaxID=602035 RepID=A0A8T9BYA3_9HELO|nr:hypothetical protein LSUE1_G005715 [Lachnellula suecica]